MPVLCQISNGTIPYNFDQDPENSSFHFNIPGIEWQEGFTMGDMWTAFLAAYPKIKTGAQISFVGVRVVSGALVPFIKSFIIDPTDTTELDVHFVIDETSIDYDLYSSSYAAGTIIISQEGDNGEHLRTTSTLVEMSQYDYDVQQPAAKAAAIASYMSQGANTDWAEESIM